MHILRPVTDAEWETIPPETLQELGFNAPGLTVRSAADIWEAPDAMPPYLIEGLLRRGELAVLAAPRALGKSWAALQLGLCVANGRGEVFGALPTASQANVLYLQAELMSWSVNRRVKQLSATVGVPPGHSFYVSEDRAKFSVQRVTTENRAARSRSETFAGVIDPRIQAQIAKSNVGLLIVDPWASYFTGNENSNDETEAVLDQLRVIATDHDCAVLIIHHISKATEFREVEDLWRGASRLADWASTRITMLPAFTDKDADKLGMSLVEARKYAKAYFLRRDEPLEPLDIYRDSNGWWIDKEAPKVEKSGERHLSIVGKPPEIIPKDVRDALEYSGGEWLTLAKAKEQLGIKSGTRTRNLLDETCRAGLIKRIGPGHHYVLPDPLRGVKSMEDVKF